MALGIAVLGSIIAATYRELTIPPGVHDDVASYAKETLGAAHEAAGALPAENAHALLTSAQSAFTDGLAVAAGVGSILLLASSVAVWLILKPPVSREIPTRGRENCRKRQSARVCEAGSLKSGHPSGRQEARR
jgi:DHA2 family multidrug resistance protein-like MFS transporter